jgi:predicted nucleotidyltransferase
MFGSAITDKFDAKLSDVDVLVEMEKKKSPIDLGESLMQLWDALEDLFKRKVDLLTPSGLKNPFLKDEIERTKKLVYDGYTEKILS